MLLPLACRLPAQCDEVPVGHVQLKILSWNIYMMPHMIIHSGQDARAKEIVEQLKNEGVDVIVFEEAFDRRARSIIREGLKAAFPYESGDPAKSAWFKGSSGVWVLSKTPLTVVKQIFFRNGRGADKMASKGAVLLQTKKQNFCFQVVATHLQSDLKGRTVTGIRQKQYNQIRKELLEPYALKDIPQFVVGDMNTMQDDSLYYRQMIRSLDVAQCSLEGDIGYSYDRTRNDIISSSDKPQLIDHIFYKSMGANVLESKMLVKIFRKKWSTVHDDLSDHFAVLGTFILPVRIF
ncbi:MAG: sphingomyelin phosphodiesterase [Bacteroidia bacterium]